MIEDVKMSGEDAREILWGDESTYEVVEDDIIGTRRWSIDHRLIVRRISDDVYFESEYSDGATENQDELPWEYGDVVFKHVVPLEVTTVTYINPVTSALREAARL